MMSLTPFGIALESASLSDDLLKVVSLLVNGVLTLELAMDGSLVSELLFLISVEYLAPQNVMVDVFTDGAVLLKGILAGRVPTSMVSSEVAVVVEVRFGDRDA